ncbi:MAG: hypothetical protein IJ688_04885 [Treponema sp.]|nr:hypothetical protein [Treponema sp.]
MKKFSLSLFILILFSALVFFIGWTQFKVKAENVGVVISKTSGVDENPVENGKFSWHWQFLLPTNASLNVFSIKPVNVSKVITGELPSGSLYTSIFSSQDDFSYRFNFSLSLTISPEAVVNLVKLNRITDSQDLQEYLERAADSLAQLSADYFLKKASENPDFRPESVRREDLLRNIRIYEEFPELELSVFALTDSKIPDYELYRKIRTQTLPKAVEDDIKDDIKDNIKDNVERGVENENS